MEEAVKQDNFAMIDHLIDKHSCRFALVYAAKHNKPYVQNYLKFAKQTENGKTALMYSAINRNFEAVKLLEEEVGMQYQGRTALAQVLDNLKDDQ